MKLVIAGVALILTFPVVAAGAVVDALAAEAPPAVVAGDIDALRTQVLSDPRVRLSANARQDIEDGRVDARVLNALVFLSARHDLGWVGPFVSGHSYFVKGTMRVSNHVRGRAVDISVIDGAMVSTRNASALEAARAALSLPAPLRPDEVGSPWSLSEPGAFSNVMHQDHLHLGWGGNP